LRLPRLLTVIAVGCLALGVAACGKDKKKSSAKATPLAMSITESGKTATYTVPASVKGGLVTLTFNNQGKAPHGAQLVRYTGGHTLAEVLKVINSQSDKTPDWIRGEGGLGSVNPGASASATVNLPAGKYVVQDIAAEGPGASKPFTVTEGDKGDLPSAPVTITAANPSKDKYKWEIDGTLKPGANNVTFESKGKEAIHFIGVFRLNGDASLAQIKKALATQNGPPPKFVDQTSFYNTSILDGGLAETTPLPISKPGTYVLFCPLKDREGGKSHEQEGLLTKVKVS
jgi:hypothetical protein